MPTVDDTDSPGPIWARDEPRIAGETDVGIVREINQDAFRRFDDPERGEILLVVADGLGGHRGGEVASEIAVEKIGKLVLEGAAEPADRLRQSIIQANEDILKRSRADHELDGMGTTVVCLLLVEDGRSYVAHVGDSRLYRLRAGRIASMTEDHSLVATLVREGVLSEEEARQDPRRHQILRALGVRDDVDVDVAPIELQPGDAYLLCSDGLHGMIDDDEILRLGRRATRPESIVRQLIEAANDAGGSDNITCVLAQIPEPMSVDSLKNAAARVIDSTRNLLSRNQNES